MWTDFGLEAQGMVALEHLQHDVAVLDVVFWEQRDGAGRRVVDVGVRADGQAGDERICCCLADATKEIVKAWLCNTDARCKGWWLGRACFVDVHCSCLRVWMRVVWASILSWRRLIARLDSIWGRERCRLLRLNGWRWFVHGLDWLLLALWNAVVNRGTRCNGFRSWSGAFFAATKTQFERFCR